MKIIDFLLENLLFSNKYSGTISNLLIDSNNFMEARMKPFIPLNIDKIIAIDKIDMPVIPNLFLIPSPVAQADWVMSL